MKKGIIAALVFISCGALAYVNTDIIFLGYRGSIFSRIWNDFSGRIGMQSLVSGGSSGFDCWRNSGAPPTGDSTCEFTVHRFNEWQDGGKMERFSMSAMATPYGNAGYRFGVEAGTGGELRDIIFCFESTGGPDGGATCPLLITQHGVFVREGGTGKLRELR